MDDYFSILRSRKISVNDQIKIKDIVDEVKVIQYRGLLSEDKIKAGSNTPCIKITKSGSRQRKGDEGTLSECVKLLVSVVSKQQAIAKDDSYFSRDMTEDIAFIRNIILHIFRKLLFSKKPEKRNFLMLYSNLENVPLEILYVFQITGFSPVTSYIAKNTSHPQNISHFVNSLSSVICYGGNSETHQKISASLLSSLVGAVYGSALGNVSEELLSSIQPQISIVLISVLEKVHGKLLSVPEEENVAVPEVDGGLDLIPVDIYGLLSEIPLLGGQNSQIILSFFSNQLAESIKFSPNLTMNQAFKKQNEWTCSKSPKHICQLLQSLLIPFDAKYALDLLKKVMLKGDFNWRILLTLMSVFISTKEDAGPIMKEYITSVLVEGFAKGCPETIKLALLIARQCGSEGKNFPSYVEWFSSMFGSKGGAKKNEGNVDVILNSMNNFKLLMTVITDLVPVESINGLRAHMSCPPQLLTSSNVRAMISDYLHLARTRLSDFGVAEGEQGGLFQSKQFGKQDAIPSSSNSVETEVKAVLEHFEKTRSLLPALLNASLFQKKYFEQTFLPCLLAPRPLPTTVDTKMKVIETLHSKRLISSAVLENYLKNCKEFGRT